MPGLKRFSGLALTGVLAAALAVGAGALLALAGCERAPGAGDGPAAAAEDREPLRHRGSIHDPRPMESVTGMLRFEGGCWTVSSGPNRIALFFPKETKLAEDDALQIGPRRLREGESYKFVGDLAETEVDDMPTCGGLSSSMAVGDAWPATGEPATRGAEPPSSPSRSSAASG